VKKEKDRDVNIEKSRERRGMRVKDFERKMRERHGEREGKMRDRETYEVYMNRFKRDMWNESKRLEEKNKREEENER
jgi:hypothetical protein